jgi:hypothetical protein
MRWRRVKRREIGPSVAKKSGVATLVTKVL